MKSRPGCQPSWAVWSIGPKVLPGGPERLVPVTRPRVRGLLASLGQVEFIGPTWSSSVIDGVYYGLHSTGRLIRTRSCLAFRRDVVRDGDWIAMGRQSRARPRSGGLGDLRFCLGVPRECGEPNIAGQVTARRGRRASKVMTDEVGDRGLTTSPDFSRQAIVIS